ncbi:2-dehydro-3-deoxygluconate kinase [Chitinispirillum alkaliphilum]|nr:2-dehydro-3-deoxygluconate kinase [Chitinispirillum alkaliphilum]
MKPIHIRDYDLLVIGESFVEFRCEGDIIHNEKFEKDIGGADLLVAATAARLGSGVQLVSSVARDSFHSFIRERLLSQGINIDHVVTSQGYNGIYFTSSRYPDVREYLVHHPGSSSKQIAPSMIYDDLIENCKIIYASSELQSVSKSTRHTIFKAFHFAHSNDIMVAYDPNLRLQRWSLDDAKECLWGVLPLLDVIFTSAPDETKALFGYERPLDVIGFLWDRGVHIVVVKTGAGGCLVGYDGKIEEFPHQTPTESLKNTTLIGSAFNGGFLHCIARGFDPFTAAEFANGVALFKGLKGGGIDSLPTTDDLNT